MPSVEWDCILKTVVILRACAVRTEADFPSVQLATVL